MQLKIFKSRKILMLTRWMIHVAVSSSIYKTEFFYFSLLFDIKLKGIFFRNLNVVSDTFTKLHHV